MKIYAPSTDTFSFTENTLSERPQDESRRHAPFAASASHRWLRCAASVQPIPPELKRPSNKASKEGTAAHLLLAWIFSNLREGRKPPIPGWIGIENENFEVDEFMIASLRRLRSLWSSADEIWSEQRVIPFIRFADTCNGTADLILWTEASRELHIIDLKYGRVPVSASANTQLILYALGAMTLVGRVPQSIRMTIYQPRVAQSGTNTVYRSPEEFAVLVKPLHQALQYAENYPEEEKAGAWCKWCNHQLHCKEFRSRFEHLLDKPASPDNLEDISKIYIAARAWMDIAEQALRAHLQSGYPLSSLKLVQGRGHRKWITAEDQVIDQLSSFIEDPSILSRPKSVAQVEKLIPKIYHPHFEALITRGSPALSMVSIEDPRPAVGGGADFDSDSDTQYFNKD